MPEKVMPGPVEGTGGIREAVCVHTRKIYDSCRDKDCIEDLRFYPKLQYVDVINHALSVKGGSADLLYVYVDVEPVNFNRGFYTVDMRFFYNVTLQAYTSCPAPVTVEGLCVFDKRRHSVRQRGQRQDLLLQVPLRGAGYPHAAPVQFTRGGCGGGGPHRSGRPARGERLQPTGLRLRSV
ncbi:MAG: hypothetical protein ACLSHO_08300 [Dysosmobacter sp.]